MSGELGRNSMPCMHLRCAPALPSSITCLKPNAIQSACRESTTNHAGMRNSKPPYAYGKSIPTVPHAFRRRGGGGAASLPSLVAKEKIICHRFVFSVPIGFNSHFVTRQREDGVR